MQEVPEAVHRLGFQTVYRTVAVISAARFFQSPRSGGLNVDQLWRHSVTVAFAAQFIAEDAGLDCGMLFTAGILHDLGKVVLAGVQTGAGGIPMAGSVDGQGEALNWERATYGFNHAEVGGRMLERWRFSDELAASVKYHHDPGAGGGAARFAACISLADTLARCLEHSSGAEPVTSVEVHTALDILGLTETPLVCYHERITENLRFIEGMCRV